MSPAELAQHTEQTHERDRVGGVQTPEPRDEASRAP